MSKDEIKEDQIKKSSDPFKVQVGGNHYAHFKIQPGEFISKNDLKWYEGNIIKYVTRSRFKGQMLEDLKKARHYLDMAIAEEEQRVNKNNANLYQQQLQAQTQAFVAGGTICGTSLGNRYAYPK